ncbi:MAG: manganese efflux pump [Methanoregula sp.]
MIVEGIRGEEDETPVEVIQLVPAIRLVPVILLSIATSIDALAVGISSGVLQTAVHFPALVIALSHLSSPARASCPVNDWTRCPSPGWITGGDPLPHWDLDPCRAPFGLNNRQRVSKKPSQFRFKPTRGFLPYVCAGNGSWNFF